MSVRRDWSGETISRIAEEVGGQPLLTEFGIVEAAFSNSNVRSSEVLHGARGLLPGVPPTAGREALVNALTHREWQVSAPVTVEHAGDQLVVISPGGFLQGDGRRLLSDAHLVSCSACLRN